MKQTPLPTLPALFPKDLDVSQEHLSDEFLFDMEGRCRTDSIGDLKRLCLSETSGFILSRSTWKGELKPCSFTKIYCISFYTRRHVSWHVNYHLENIHTKNEMLTQWYIKPQTLFEWMSTNTPLENRRTFTTFQRFWNVERLFTLMLCSGVDNWIHIYNIRFQDGSIVTWNVFRT